MKIKNSISFFLITSFFVCFLFACNYSGNFVSKVIDGDTIVLANGTKVRYIGINTPEKGQPYSAEATNLNTKLVEGKEVYLEYDKEKEDVFGRTLAYVYTKEDGFVNEILIENGVARAFFRAPNVRYRTILQRAEEKAMQKGVGLFTPSDYAGDLIVTSFQFDAEGNDNDNINGEWFILLNNSGETIFLQNFYFYDESYHRYLFPDYVLKSGSSIKVHTGNGENTATNLYAGFDEPIWNNAGDTLFIYDYKDCLVLEEEY